MDKQTEIIVIQGLYLVAWMDGHLQRKELTMILIRGADSRPGSSGASPVGVVCGVSDHGR